MNIRYPIYEGVYRILTILQEFGCNGKAFNDTGEFTEAGAEAYGRVEHFLSDIGTLTGISVEPIIRELDEISNTNY